MRLTGTALALVMGVTQAFAGNLDTFEEPVEEPIIEEPMGSSNAAWIVPLLAILVVAAVASSGGDDDDDDDEEEDDTPSDMILDVDPPS